MSILEKDDKIETGENNETFNFKGIERYECMRVMHKESNRFEGQLEYEGIHVLTVILMVCIGRIIMVKDWIIQGATGCGLYERLVADDIEYRLHRNKSMTGNERGRTC